MEEVICPEDRKADDANPGCAKGPPDCSAFPLDVVLCCTERGVVLVDSAVEGTDSEVKGGVEMLFPGFFVTSKVPSVPKVTPAATRKRRKTGDFIRAKQRKLAPFPVPASIDFFLNAWARGF